MNWVFETYSNVYSTAMMQDTKSVARPRKAGSKVGDAIARLFRRG